MKHVSRSMSLVFLGALATSFGCDFLPGYLGATGDAEAGVAAESEAGANTEPENVHTGSSANPIDDTTFVPGTTTFVPGTTTSPTLIETETDDLAAPCLSVIDDFEDGDGVVPAHEGRSGVWSTYHEGTPGTIQDPPPGSPLVPSSAGLPEGHLGARTSGQASEQGIAGLAVELASGEPYDASEYTGVSFTIRALSDRRAMLDFQVLTTEPLPLNANGSCDPETTARGCENYYQQAVFPGFGYDLSHHAIRFSDLLRPSWGDSFEFAPAHIHVLRWQTRIGAEFDFIIDDVCFF